MLANETTAIIHCGREISVQEIEEIQEIVHLCGRLSRKELAKTISENLQWYTASGTNKVDACLKLLEKLASQGVLELPQKRAVSNPTVKSAIRLTERTGPAPEIVCRLKNLGPVELEVDFGSDQGRSDFATAGVAALRFGLQKRANAGLGQKMPFLDGHDLFDGKLCGELLLVNPHVVKRKINRPQMTQIYLLHPRLQDIVKAVYVLADQRCILQDLPFDFSVLLRPLHVIQLSAGLLQ